MPTERRHEIRGARDLAQLWRELPAAVLAYPASACPPHLGLAALSDTLRARAWREHCASTTLPSCAERGHDCAQPGHCRADALFPVKLGGGAPSWRMATLIVRWRPALEQLHLIALGAPACTMLGWAARCLREHHGLEGAEPLAVATLADLELTDASRWELTLVTPWLVGKGRMASDPTPDVETVAHELRKAMRQRAHKLTPLCLDDSRAQRLVSHLAHHVAEALLPDGVQVEQAEITSESMTLASRGNGASFTALTWSGRALVRVAPPARPWLSLIAVCGGGENTDKGFGGVELIPVD